MLGNRLLRITMLLLLVSSGALSLARPKGADPDTMGEDTYRLRREAIASAGINMTASDLRNGCTLGQSSPVGASSSQTYRIRGGFWVRHTTFTSIDGPAPHEPVATALIQNRPNPFSTSTDIRYFLREKCDVEISIFDVGGRRVCTLVEGMKPAGRHHVSWNRRNTAGRRMPPGIYFCRLRTRSHTEVKKMLVLE